MHGAPGEARTRWILTAISLTFVGIVVLFQAYHVTHDRAAVFAEARTEAAHHAEIFAEQAANALQIGDLIALNSVGEIERDLAAGGVRPSERSAEMEFEILNLALVLETEYFDAEGKRRAGFRKYGAARRTAADCPGFQAHRAGTTTQSIGQLCDGADGEIALMRTVSTSDGAFAGVVMTAIDRAALETHYQNVALRREIITLFQHDGAIAAAWPKTMRPGPRALDDHPLWAAHRAFLRDDRDATTTRTLMTDQYTAAVRPLERFPLSLAVALDHEAVLAAWRDDVTVHLAVGVGLVASLAGFALVVRTLLDRRRQAELALRLAHDDLEQRVASRTQQLQHEISVRKAVEMALRESEERFLQFMDHTPVAAYMKDGEGRYLYVNREFTQLYGIAGNDCIGRRSRDVLPSDQSDEDEIQDSTVLATETVQSWEVDLTVGGRPRTLLMYMFPVKYTGARPLLGGITLDMTLHRAAERQLLHSQKMEALGQLTGGVAHDFGNLLTIIRGNLEMLADKVADTPLLRDLTAEADHAAQRGANLTNRLLALSRNQPMMRRVVDVNAVVASMHDLLVRTLGEEIDAEFTAAPAPAWVHVDMTWLENAVLNLALNARDAMPSGGRLRVAVGSRVVEDTAESRAEGLLPGAYVTLVVTDTGTGMPPQVLERALEPFFTTKDTGKGTGLGLSMVYGFAIQSGGAVKLASTVGAGTTVSLYLPARPPAAAAPEVSPPARDMPRGRETVLVVEDEAGVRKLAVTMLRDLGYHVLEAENGPAALDLLAARPTIDAVFTDVVMPGGMNGFDLAEAMRARWPQVAIVFTSGYSEAARIPIPADADNLLRKPYDKARLAQAVRQALGPERVG